MSSGRHSLASRAERTHWLCDVLAVSRVCVGGGILSTDTRNSRACGVAQERYYCNQFMYLFGLEFVWLLEDLVTNLDQMPYEPRNEHGHGNRAQLFH